MPQQDVGEKIWRRAYLKMYREEQKALKREKALQHERTLMKKALHRIAVAEKWESEHPESPPGEYLFSLRHHWDAIMEEEKAKERKKLPAKKRVAENSGGGFESVP